MVRLLNKTVNISVSAGTSGSALTTVSEKQTTGSITAGSDILTVADGSGLSVGDWVVIATGGEEGAGARGTRGVGGAWPALSYANATAMNADTSQSNNEMCWLESTGDTYYRNTGTSAWVAVATSDYYYQKAIPKALTAQITARIGNKIKLDRNAVVSTTNAPVYFDNWGIIQNAVSSGLTVNIPSGEYYCSGFIQAVNRDGLVFSGAGKSQTFLRTPRGACPVGITLQDSDNSVIRDVTFDVGFKNDRYSMQWSDSRVGLAFYPGGLWQEFYRNSFGLPRAVFVGGSPNSEILDCDAINPGIQGFTSSFAFDVWFRRCTVVVEDPRRSYLQWMMQIADGTRGGFEDCTIDSNWLISGYEPFKSRDVTFRRCTARNAVSSHNSSDGTLFEDLDLTIEAGSQGLSHIGSNDPIFQVNQNAGGGFNTNVTRFVNPRVIQEGYPNPSWRLIGFVLNTGTCPVEITGTYDTDPTTPKGLIDMQVGPTGFNSFEGLGIRSSGTLTVEGIRIKGTPPGSNSMVHTEGGALTITNSIFDPDTPTGTFVVAASGNQTNAEYEA